MSCSRELVVPDLPDLLINEIAAEIPSAVLLIILVKRRRRDSKDRGACNILARFIEMNAILVLTEVGRMGDASGHSR